MDTASRFDAIVIGAGHNGLATACALAKSGRRVLVLEAKNAPGGLAAAVEFCPGFIAPGVLHDVSCPTPRAIELLGLERFGLVLGEPPGVLQLGNDASEGGLVLAGDLERDLEEIGRWSRRDLDAYRQWMKWTARIASELRPLLENVPFDITTGSVVSLWQMAKRAWGVRRLGRSDLMELSRVLPMSIADWLSEWFECEMIRCALCWPALEGMFAGPRSPATSATLLRWLVLRGRSVVGGGPALIEAMVASARSRGVELWTDATVNAINAEHGAVRGVTLLDGREIASGVVVAACDVKRTLLQLLRGHRLAPVERLSLQAFRTRGVTALLRLSLRGPIEFTCRRGESIARARTGATLDEFERAFDAVKYGRFSDRPVLDIRITSANGQELLHDGPCTMTVLAQWVPHMIRGGWTAEARTSLQNTIVNELSRHIEGLREAIEDSVLMTPVDLERDYALTDGHVHHGEHALDQLLVRPARGFARYATPMNGLFLAGGGSFPGGGITCLPGLNAAEAILRS